MMSRLLLCVMLLVGVGCSSAKVAQGPVAVAPSATPSFVEGIRLNPMSTLPGRSPASAIATRVTLTSAGSSDVQWDWLDFDGKLVRYGSLAGGEQVEQPTYVEHVWIITRDGVQLGWFAATEAAIDLVVR